MVVQQLDRYVRCNTCFGGLVQGSAGGHQVGGGARRPAAQVVGGNHAPYGGERHVYSSGAEVRLRAVTPQATVARSLANA